MNVPIQKCFLMGGPEFNKTWVDGRICNTLQTTTKKGLRKTFISLKLSSTYLWNTWSHFHFSYSFINLKLLLVNLHYLKPPLKAISYIWSFLYLIYLFINLELLSENIHIYFIEAIFNIFSKYLELLPFYWIFHQSGASSSESTFLRPHLKDI